MDEPMSHSGPLEESLESLVINGDHNPGLLFWAMHRVSRLTSLELRRMPGNHEWSVFFDLFVACASSLRTLYLDVGLHYWCTYFYPDPPSQGWWFNEDLDLEFPFTLSACKSLKDVFILTLISDVESGGTVEFALPAIVRLLKTAPSLQSVILSIECEIPDAKCLGQLDWSLLDGVCPRIELRMSGDDMKGCWFTPQVILDSLAGNEVLVQRNLVILNPGINDY